MNETYKNQGKNRKLNNRYLKHNIEQRKTPSKENNHKNIFTQHTFPTHTHIHIGTLQHLLRHLPTW